MLQARQSASHHDGSRIRNPIGLTLLDTDGDCIERIVLAPSRPEAVGEADKIAFVEGIERGDYRMLDNLVFQRRDTQRPLCATCFGDVGP